MNKTNVKILSLSIILLLGLMSATTFWRLNYPQSVEAALPPEKLTIISLYNNLGNTIKDQDGNQWAVTPQYDKSAIIFAVIPAGKAPYKWWLANSSLGTTLEPSPQGFSVKLRPRESGQTTLYVQDAKAKITGKLSLMITEVALESFPMPIEAFNKVDRTSP